MSETKWTPGPWHVTENSEVADSQGIIAAEIMGERRDIYVANARLIAAAPELASAAQLACLMFERKNLSSADSDWMGDDEHEAWSALERALAKARGEE
jgi:hypothetical protein